MSEDVAYRNSSAATEAPRSCAVRGLKRAAEVVASAPGLRSATLPAMVQWRASMYRPERAIATLCVAALAAACSGSGSGSATSDDAAAGDDPPTLVRDAGAEVPVARTRRPERAVYGLGPNLVSARLERDGGVYIDAGSAGFAKYLRFARAAPRWALGQRRDERMVAVPERAAALVIALTAAQADAKTVAVGLHATEPGSLRLKVGGRSAGSASLVAGWQVARVEVAKDRLQAGDNVLAFEFGRGPTPAVAWLQIGGALVAAEAALDAATSEHGQAADGAVEPATPPATPGTPAPALSAQSVAGQRFPSPVSYDPDADELRLIGDASLTYHLYVPAGANLVAGLRGRASAGGRCELQVEAQAALAASAPTKPAPSAGGVGTVRGVLSASAASALAPQAVDLGALAGKVARLSLTLSGCSEAILSGPRITIPEPTETRLRAAPPRHVVLWLMSGLRADRVRPFAPWARPEVPGFERLAATGTIAAPMWAQDSRTAAARAAIWTGRYPIRASAAESDEASAREIRTQRQQARISALGSEMRAAGLHPLAFTADLDRVAGFADGFADWTRVPSSQPDMPAAGAEVVARALEAIDAQRADKPLFIALQTADSRLPWRGHEPWLKQYHPSPYEGPLADAAKLSELGASAGAGATGAGAPDRVRCTASPDEPALAQLRAMYDATVSYQDALLVQLVDQLAQWGMLDQTLLIITADHGQELWEVGRCGHGASLRDSLLGVPLVLHYPPLVPGSQVITGGAEAIDILPTTLRILGLPAPAYVQGQSLLEPAYRARGADADYPRPSFAALGDDGHAVRLAEFKLVVGTGGAQALYDLGTDPTEKRDLSAAHEIERQLLRDLLALHRAYRTRWNQRVWGSPAALTVEGWRQLERADEP